MPLTLRIEKVVHGGLFLARPEGKVVMTTGALPGELVEVEVIEEKKNFVLARTTKVLEPSPHRVVSPGEELGRAKDSIDFGHANLDYQRDLKHQVLAEALERTGGLSAVAKIQAADETGLSYRTRVQLHADSKGRLGVRVPRSHDHVRISSHPLARPEINESGLLKERYEPGSRVQISLDSLGQVSTGLEKLPLIQNAGSRKFKLPTGVFWQAHFAAPEILLSEVMGHLAADQGEVLDLYSGAGLFAANIAASQPGAKVVAVESDRAATKSGVSSASDLVNLSFLTSDVLAYLRKREEPIETVVLDPPRSGASGKVIAEITRLAASRIVYVACDPVALARDLGTLTQSGYQLDSIQGYDIFPQTHHFETVAVLCK